MPYVAKPGDLIVIVQSDGEFYQVGDRAVIIAPRQAPMDEGVWADFNNQGNKHVEDKGIWCVSGDDGGSPDFAPVFPGIDDLFTRVKNALVLTGDPSAMKALMEIERSYYFTSMVAIEAGNTIADVNRRFNLVPKESF